MAMDRYLCVTAARRWVGKNFVGRRSCGANTLTSGRELLATVRSLFAVMARGGVDV